MMVVKMKSCHFFVFIQIICLVISAPTDDISKDTAKMVSNADAVSVPEKMPTQTAGNPGAPPGNPVPPEIVPGDKEPKENSAQGNTGPGEIPPSEKPVTGSIVAPLNNANTQNRVSGNISGNPIPDGTGFGDKEPKENSGQQKGTGDISKSEKPVTGSKNPLNDTEAQNKDSGNLAQPGNPAPHEARSGDKEPNENSGQQQKGTDDISKSEKPVAGSKNPLNDTEAQNKDSVKKAQPGNPRPQETDYGDKEPKENSGQQQKGTNGMPVSEKPGTESKTLLNNTEAQNKDFGNLGQSENPVNKALPGNSGPPETGPVKIASSEAPVKPPTTDPSPEKNVNPETKYTQKLSSREGEINMGQAPANNANNKLIMSQIDEPDIPTSGHFMAYFVTTIVMVVIVYLVYHNRQKVIAIVLEGGRARKNGRSRRPNSSDYNQLSTNIEEAMPSMEKTKDFIY